MSYSAQNSKKKTVYSGKAVGEAYLPLKKVGSLHRSVPFLAPLFRDQLSRFHFMYSMTNPELVTVFI